MVIEQELGAHTRRLRSYTKHVPVSGVCASARQKYLLNSIQLVAKAEHAGIDVLLLRTLIQSIEEIENNNRELGVDNLEIMHKVHSNTIADNAHK